LKNEDFTLKKSEVFQYLKDSLEKQFNTTANIATDCGICRMSIVIDSAKFFDGGDCSTKNIKISHFVFSRKCQKIEEKKNSPFFTSVMILPLTHVGEYQLH
jgi:hypothetical protein